MRNYLIGLVFILFGGYRIYISSVFEAILYFCVGVGFVLMGAAKDQRFERFKRTINILSWIFVIAGVLLFIALLRKDVYGW